MARNPGPHIAETTDEAPSRHTAVRLLIVVVATMFVVEVGAHSLVARILDTSQLPSFVSALLDGSLLVMALYPVLYLLFLRPLLAESAARRRVAEDLRASEASYRAVFVTAQEQAAAAQTAWREAEVRAQQLETVIEAIPEGIMVADQQGNVVVANSALAAEAGFADRAEALRPLAEYPPAVQVCRPDGQPCPLADWAIMRALRGERIQLEEVRLRWRKGHKLLAQVSAVPVRDERGVVTQAVMVARDVTQQRRWEHHRATLARVGQALSQGLDLDAILQTVAGETLAGLGADTVSVSLADPPRQELVLAVQRNLRPETVQALQRIPFDAPLLTARAFATGAIQVVEDTDRLPAGLSLTHTLTEQENVRSLLAVPLSAAGRPIGAMIFATHTRRYFSPDDLETVARVADLFGMAIENARLYEETQRRAAELEEERRRREELTSVIAHELRGPMTVLLGYTDMLRRWEDLTLAQRGRTLEAIREQVRKLNGLLSDLLDFSRIAAGHLAIERSTTDLLAVARQVVEEQQATTDRHRVLLAAGEGLPAGHWDRDRVVQALTNLVSNAVKYSPEGGTVEVALQPTAAGEAQVSVRDHGIGIAPADMALLFQPYSRLHRARRARGVGLGLYITKGIVEAHGGRIWVDSAPDQGSTFYFTLPAA